MQKGEYKFQATYPGTYSGRPIPHIHYKVQYKKVYKEIDQIIQYTGTALNKIENTFYVILAG